MSATNGTYWFWSDWMGDISVRRLTPAERGVWIDLLALAAVGKPTGYVCDAYGKPLPLDEIARVVNAGSIDEAAELINGILRKGAASRDRSGRLFNRRMVRDAEKQIKKAALSEKRAQNGRSGGNATALKNKAIQSLPQQMPQLLPQQVPKQSLETPTRTKSISLTAPSVGETERTGEIAVLPTASLELREQIAKMGARK